MCGKILSNTYSGVAEITVALLNLCLEVEEHCTSDGIKQEKGNLGQRT